MNIKVIPNYCTSIVFDLVRLPNRIYPRLESDGRADTSIPAAAAAPPPPLPLPMQMRRYSNSCLVWGSATARMPLYQDTPGRRTPTAATSCLVIDTQLLLHIVITRCFDISIIYYLFAYIQFDSCIYSVTLLRDVYIYIYLLYIYRILIFLLLKRDK